MTLPRRRKSAAERGRAESGGGGGPGQSGPRGGVGGGWGHGRGRICAAGGCRGADTARGLRLGVAANGFGLDLGCRRRHLAPSRGGALGSFSSLAAFWRAGIGGVARPGEGRGAALGRALSAPRVG